LTKPGELASRLLARLVGIGKEEVSWRLAHERPWFENHVATLELKSRRATLTFEKAVLNGSGKPNLEIIYKRHLV